MNEQPPPLALFRYAEALVYRAEYPAALIPKIFGMLGVDPDAFASAAAYWNARMADELSRGRPSLLLDLARAYGRLEGSVRLHRPSVDAIRPQKEPRTLESSRVPPRREIAPLQPKTSTADPSPAPRAPEGALVPSYLRPAVASQSPVIPSVPLAPPAPLPSQPEVRLPPASLAPTAPLPASAVAAGEALGSARQAARRETAWVAPGEAPPVSLPFVKDAPVRAPTPSLRQPPPPRPPRERGTALAPDDFAAGPAIPFHEVEVKAEQIDFSMFPIERYAEVSFALATAEDRGKILRRFVLTETMWKAVSTAWGERVMNDPSLRAKYAEIVKSLRGRLQE